MTRLAVDEHAATLRPRHTTAKKPEVSSPGGVGGEKVVSREGHEADRPNGSLNLAGALALPAQACLGCSLQPGGGRPCLAKFGFVSQNRRPRLLPPRRSRPSP